MATIYVDGKAYEVDPGRNLLHACLELGLDLPYFCWHPELGSVGACRQCAVKQYRDEHDTKGKIIMACMTPAADGTRISIEDPEAREFRASIIEWLMLSHPHDCPICDEGGECHLQDMTVMTGHDYRRYRGLKRTFQNQYLGPFVNHEMNRCIQCYRCVRFYNDYAGGRDFGAHMLRNQVYFGRQTDGVLESEFSGNLVEVCPTGVFTDKSLKRHYTRKWDLQTAPSICVHCAIGCNTLPGERYGTLRRIRNRYHGEVNRYFLCDRGRYGYEFVNSERRIRRPMLRRAAGTAAEPATREEALAHLAGILAESQGVIGIGSPRASLEANFALRTLVGAENFCLGTSDEESELISAAVEILRQGPARSPSLHDAMRADAVLVLGEDLTNTAPMLALALRQSVRQQPMETARKQKIPDWQDTAVREALQHQRGPLFIATPAATRLDEIARGVLRAAPDDIARLGFAVASVLNPACPEVPGLPGDTRALAAQIAADLAAARRPLIVAGTSLGSKPILQAAANAAWALTTASRTAELSLVVAECNTVGIGLMGGAGISRALASLRQKTADTLLILENDLYRRGDATTVDALFAGARHVAVIDSLANDTTARAEVVLPAATFAESTGTLVNNEGRAQRAYQVFTAGGEVAESWRWLQDIMVATHRAQEAAWKNLDDVTEALARALPVFSRVPDMAPAAEFRMTGQKIPREPHRYSGRTAMLAHIEVSEPKPPSDSETPFSFSMEGYPGHPPAALIHEFWAPGWNSIQAVNKFQKEIGGPLHGGDPGRRLIEPPSGASLVFFADVPPPFQLRHGEYLAVPLFHIFGSEELSMLSPGIAELAPEPCLALNPADARVLAVDDGANVLVEFKASRHRLPVRLTASLPAGVVGIASGLPAWRGPRAPEWVRLAALR
ncbi:MAG: NADH-quinone oxidoreductase subunit NuoG [Acidobacteriia bacterium]|nr:NADH-quinone oxidoreductase subunit NuoG [Terriglobia bacterium]